MSKLSRIGDFKFVVIPIVVVILVSAVTIAIISLNQAPNTQTNEVKEAANDMQFNVGSGYPGMADMISTSIAKNQNNLTAIINVKEPFTALGEQEIAEFDMIVILEDAEEVLQTYELRVDINSTGTFALVQDVQNKTQQPAQLQVDGTKLTITTTIPELTAASQAEWNIYSAYEKRAGTEIISSAYDFLPDEGLNLTTFPTA